MSIRLGEVESSSGSGGLAPGAATLTEQQSQTTILTSIDEKLLKAYNLNNLEDAVPLYVGLVDPGGKYLIKKFSETTGIMLYANVSNNPSVTTYDSAWTNRATLTYSKFHEISGV
jgi:hypothetical protein